MFNQHVMDFQPALTIVLYEATGRGVLISSGGVRALALTIPELLRAARFVQQEQALTTGEGELYG
jgi:hypothetical protein